MINEQRLDLIDRRKVYEKACAGCIRHGEKPGECYHDEPCEHLMFEFTVAEPVDAVEVKKYKALVEMYHELRENFIDYYCSGIPNVAPYCLNKCEGCTDSRGWCKNGSDKCHGFNPAEVILDGGNDDG